MAKQIKQFRYYQEDIDNDTSTSQNEPKSLAQRELASGEAFKEYFPVSQLGIQALPGTKFYLNNNTHSVIVGLTGTYELNLEGKAEITALQFDNESINATRLNDNAYIIIDIVYEDGEG